MKQILNRSAFLILSFLALQSIALGAATERPPEEALRFVNKLMSRMTVKEKAAQLVQVTAGMTETGPGQTAEWLKMIGRGEVGSVLNSYSLEMMQRLQHLAVDKTRLKIPLLFAGDIVNGFQTKFPVPLAESCSWDLNLIEKSARIAATEAASIGLDWTYAPMVDIARDPRWGRVVEGAGEDPFWGGKVAAARVKGFQGKSLSDPDALMSCAKHFAGYGAAQAGRDYNSAELTEREMREVYLPPFKAAVDAGVATLMAAFNDIAGVPNSANPWLLKTILRKEWGFRGFVVSDYAAIPQLMNHGVAGTTEDAAKLSFRAGLDVDMEGDVYHKHLASLVEREVISVKALDNSVRHVLLAKYKRGLFQDPFRFMNAKRAQDVPMSEEALSHAREIAKRSIVLMKNDGTLPLKREGRIALIGPLAELEQGWAVDGPIQGVKKPSVTFLSSMRQEQSRGGFELSYARGTQFKHYGGLNDKRPDSELLQEAMTTAANADVIVVAIGESPGESGEAASKTQIRIAKNQRRLLKRLKTLGKPIVTVLFNGRPLVLDIENENSNAILETWFLGTMAGEAITDVLFGDYNPSGKLTVTFPRNEGQIPIYYAVRNTGRPETDDMWTSKYLDSPNSPQYPFGWGLSYTTFKYSDLKVSARNSKVLDVSVTVTNTGSRAGEEVVQLYIRDLVASVARPIQLLKGFQKILLQPGESRRVRLALTEEDLKFYNADMHWVSESGRFKVMVGGNSVEVISAEFGLSKSSVAIWDVK